MSTRNDTIAVLSCRPIGESWSALFTAYGYDVVGWNPMPKSQSPIARSDYANLRTDSPSRRAASTEGASRLAETTEAAVSNAFGLGKMPQKSWPSATAVFRVGRARGANRMTFTAKAAETMPG